MTSTRLILTFIALAVLPIPAKSYAEARSITAEYSVKIRGFLVGRAEFRADLSESLYTMRFSAAARGLGRLFSDAETVATVSGKLGRERMLPKHYNHTWTEDGETETVEMRFSGRAVTAIHLDPPRRRPERYVPFTEQSNANAFDLVSAFLWPVEKVDDTTCNHALPLVDGRRRFDITLSFARFDNFTTPDGSFSSPVVVCGIRYIPVAGHRKDKPDDSILDADDTEVWMAPVGEGLVMPTRIQLQSRAGRILLEATDVASN